LLVLFFTAAASATSDGNNLLSSHETRHFYASLAFGRSVDFAANPAAAPTTGLANLPLCNGDCEKDHGRRKLLRRAPPIAYRFPFERSKPSG